MFVSMRTTALDTLILYLYVYGLMCIVYNGQD